MGIDKIDSIKTASARLLAAAFLSTAILTGCSSVNTQGSNSSENKVITASADNSNLKSTEEQNKLMETLKTLVAENSGITDVIKFIDSNISVVSRENSSVMVNELENLQKKNLKALEDKFNKEESIQSSLSKIYKSDTNFSTIDKIEDAKIKALLTETLDSGYKVETAEGMFFPVINYEFYKKYSTYVTKDFKDYIDIMAVESNKVPAKDAALVISWDDIVKRALTHEQFISKHKDSVKLQDIKNLYNKYISFSLFGLNNTPLFAYETKEMVPEAKKAFSLTSVSSISSEYYKILGDYMQLLQKNNYKLTDEVDKYRKDTMQKINDALAQKPQIEVPYDIKVEENEQKSVDAGHSPWRLDPAYVAQVFVSLKISPEGIKGDYPIKYEEFKVVQINSKSAIVEVGGDKTPISKVYLKRLVKQDDTGIWTVVGYDPLSK